MSKRRTNPGFLSDGETARERARLQQMVRGIAGALPSQAQTNTEGIPNKDIDQKMHSNQILVGPEFWRSNKGLLVRAIVIDRAYNKDAILRVTGLAEKDYRQAATELFQAKLLKTYEKISGNLSVTKQLYYLCKKHFEV